MYAPESKINTKLHQTYINNMTNTNTHKMQCMIQNNKKNDLVIVKSDYICPLFLDQ